MKEDIDVIKNQLLFGKQGSVGDVHENADEIVDKVCLISIAQAGTTRQVYVM